MEIEGEVAVFGEMLGRAEGDVGVFLQRMNQQEGNPHQHDQDEDQPCRPRVRLLSSFRKAFRVHAAGC